MLEVRLPRKEKTWRDHAQACIAECCLIWHDHNGYLPRRSMPKEEKDRFMAMVRRAYPFGQRRYFPYKVWLSEVKRLRESLYFEPKPVDCGLFAEGQP